MRLARSPWHRSRNLGRAAEGVTLMGELAERSVDANHTRAVGGRTRV